MNQVRVFIWLFGAIAGFSHAALNTEDKNLIVSAASKAGGEENESCSYTTRRNDGKTVQEERYNAGAENPWRLLTVDGKLATTRQKESYKSEYRGNHPASLGLDDLDFTEFSRVESADDVAVFTFVPKENGEVMDEAIRGEMIVDLTTETVTSMEVKTIKPFSRAMVFKMNAFRQFFELGYDEEVGAVVMQNLDMEMRGKAMLKKIEVAFNMQFFDFDCPR